jgi:hypothetical protein
MATPCPDLAITLFADDSASSLQALRAGKALVIDFCAARRRPSRILSCGATLYFFVIF